MTIYQCLELSTAYVTQETMAWMNGPPADVPLTIAPYRYGAFVVVPDNEQIIDELSCPDDLKLVMQHARNAGCMAIRLDSDAGVIQSLPYFEW